MMIAPGNIGHERTFTELVNVYEEKLIAVSFNITKSRPVAEDMVQEVFLALWKKTGIGWPDNIGGWLYGAVCNLSYKHLKKEHRKTAAIQFLRNRDGEIYSNVEEKLIAKERAVFLENVLNRLPQKRQLVFHLNKYEGLNRNEIAQKLNISANTVKNHLAKAIQFVKEQKYNSFILLFFTSGTIFLSNSSTNTAFEVLYNTKQAEEKILSDKDANEVTYSVTPFLLR